MAVIRHIGERRRQAARLSESLDSALEGALAEVDAAKGNFEAELAAARALALASTQEPLPPEPLMALRAGLAAKASARAEPRRAGWVRTGVPGAVAASVLGLLGYVAVTGSGAAPPSLAGATTAATTLRIINEKMAQVQTAAASGNKDQAQAAANSAGQALVQAQQQAVALPASDPLRELLLSAAMAEIAQLKALLAQLQLEVPVLPSVGSGSHPASGSSTSTSSGGNSPAGATAASTTSTTSAPTTTAAPTTTTTKPIATTTTTVAATTSTTAATTTTSTSTTSSTTSTTSTTAGTQTNATKPRGG